MECLNIKNEMPVTVGVLGNLIGAGDGDRTRDVQLGKLTK